MKKTLMKKIKCRMCLVFIFSISQMIHTKYITKMLLLLR